MTKLFSFFSVAALSLGLAASASATTFTVSNTLPAGYSFDSFASTVGSSTNLGGVWTGTANTGTTNTSSVNNYLDPLPSGSTQNYAYSEAGGTISATFATPLTSLWLAWGSPDTYNTITVNGVAYTSTAIGLTTNQTTTQYVQISGPITSLAFDSSTNAFEFDDLVATATPEPSTFAMLIGGLVTLGAGVIRRRK